MKPRNLKIQSLVKFICDPALTVAYNSNKKITPKISRSLTALQKLYLLIH